MGLLMLIYYQFDKSKFIFFGAITYFIISKLLRGIIAKEHLKATSKAKHEHYEEAIPHFLNSYEFFKRNSWVDKYRFLTLLSSDKISFKEMALLNIAFCYGQIGNGILSKNYYEKTLAEFPENAVAKAGLRLLNSMSNTNY